MDENQIFEEIKLKLARKSQNHGQNGCLRWCGTTTPASKIPTYGKMRLKPPGAPASRYFYCHRLSFISKMKTFDIPNDMHVSHLCRFSLCVNPDHLSLEPAMINNERQQCGDYCKGHKLGDVTFPACIFRLALLNIHKTRKEPYLHYLHYNCLKQEDGRT